VAAEAGCDAVKFQKRTPEICVPLNVRNQIRETPWGEMTYFDYKKKTEFGQVEYDEINRRALKKGIAWSASAWDIPSLEFLDRYNLPFHKIASALSTHKEFISEVAKRGKKTFASVGMCTFDEIDYLVNVFKKSGTQLVLMHTVSTYPANEKDLNLRLINTYKERYGLDVGYSGHETSISPSIVAATIGAIAIERHITLDRSMWGTDHAASLEPSGLRLLVGSIRKVHEVLGDGVKREIPGEENVASKLRYWN
jgi:N-acetylneuraminate synthase